MVVVLVRWDRNGTVWNNNNEESVLGITLIKPGGTIGNKTIMENTRKHKKLLDEVGAFHYN